MDALALRGIGAQRCTYAGAQLRLLPGRAHARFKVGDPEGIVAWLSGSSLRPQRVVDPGGARKPPELALDFVGTLDNAALLINRLYPGTRRLVFIDSRRRVEDLVIASRWEEWTSTSRTLRSRSTDHFDSQGRDGCQSRFSLDAYRELSGIP